MFDLLEVQLVRIWAAAAIARISTTTPTPDPDGPGEHRRLDQRGEIAQTVLIVAILAAAAIAIATIIATKFKGKANDIPTE